MIIGPYLTPEVLFEILAPRARAARAASMQHHLQNQPVVVGGVSTDALLVPATSSMALRVRIYGAYA